MSLGESNETMNAQHATKHHTDAHAHTSSNTHSHTNTYTMSGARARHNSQYLSKELSKCTGGGGCGKFQKARITPAGSRWLHMTITKVMHRCLPKPNFMKVIDFTTSVRKPTNAVWPHRTTTYENNHKMTHSEELLSCQPNDNVVNIIKFG